MIPFADSRGLFFLSEELIAIQGIPVPTEFFEKHDAKYALSEQNLLINGAKYCEHIRNRKAELFERKKFTNPRVSIERS